LALYKPIEKKPVRTTLVSKISGVSMSNQAALLLEIKKGLPFKAFEVLKTALEINRNELAVLLSINESTLTRRKNKGFLLAQESDRVIRFAKLFDQANILLQGDKNATLTWLKSPLEILSGESPLEHAQTELGTRDVEDLIGRIRHGIFS
jgi:putative toxin-antitoxin system antitoxin component (TIGR02293 family)